jgi:hypothetical protein
VSEDPKPSDRVYYRSAKDGQRAYLVRREGKDMLKLDRPMEEILHRIDLENLTGWVPDVQLHPLTKHAVGKVAYDADVALRRAMGIHMKPQETEWLSMKEQDRIKWMESGPASGDVRMDLYDAIMGTLSSLTDGS